MIARTALPAVWLALGAALMLPGTAHTEPVAKRQGAASSETSAEPERSTSTDLPASQPSAAAPIDYESLRAELDGKPRTVHRFRVRVAQVHAELKDLDFRIPVSGGLESFTLAVNGGYWEWHRDKPRAMGLVVSQGLQLAPLRKKLEGGVLIVGRERARIVSSRRVQLPEDTQLAVQCRPRLVEAGRPIPRLDGQHHAARTAVCVREHGRRLDIVLSDPSASGPTLAGLASWLAADGCEDALNLDGGPSTAAAYREDERVLRLGAGVFLPYALRFRPR